MTDLLQQLTEKKKKLDGYRPLPTELVKNLDEWFRVELTYTSNAIEGNTLTRSETALVVEKGITVNGKTLTEHLEAINHAEAIDFIKELVGKKRKDVTKKDILDTHWLILKKIDDANAGRYRTIEVGIRGVDVPLPSPLKVPELMEDFYKWLHSQNPDHPVKIAADAHYRFVSIHPFADRNGRTARLLLNILLMQTGYPPALIRKEDRRDYINSIGKAQLRNDFGDYYKVIYKAVDRSLNIYLDALNPNSKKTRLLETKGKILLKIGELSQETGVPIHTLRFWTKEELLDVKDFSEGGYRLYDRSMIERVKEIRRLQTEEHLPLTEIKTRFGKIV